MKSRAVSTGTDDLSAGILIHAFTLDISYKQSPVIIMSSTYNIKVASPLSIFTNKVQSTLFVYPNAQIALLYAYIHQTEHKEIVSGGKVFFAI